MSPHFTGQMLKITKKFLCQFSCQATSPPSVLSTTLRPLAGGGEEADQEDDEARQPPLLSVDIPDLLGSLARDDLELNDSPESEDNNNNNNNNKQ